MVEYIEREALIKELEADFNTDWADYASKNNFDKDYIDGVRDEYDDTLTIICQQKTADVQPIKHGKWLSRCEGDIYDFSECSECGNIESCETPYCAQCGARMDLKDGDAE